MQRCDLRRLQTQDGWHYTTTFKNHFLQNAIYEPWRVNTSGFLCIYARCNPSNDSTPPHLPLPLPPKRSPAKWPHFIDDIKTVSKDASRHTYFILHWYARTIAHSTDTIAHSSGYRTKVKRRQKFHKFCLFFFIFWLVLFSIQSLPGQSVQQWNDELCGSQFFEFRLQTLPSYSYHYCQQLCRSSTKIPLSSTGGHSGRYRQSWRSWIQKSTIPTAHKWKKYVALLHL